MSLIWSRATRASRALAQAGHRRTRQTGAALVLVLGLLFASTACGMDVQTNQPYTPGEGVNFDVGAGAEGGNNEDGVVLVRNLLIISHGPGEGIISGSIVTDGRDTLTAVSGNAIKTDGSPGAPFTATIPNGVTLANNLLVVLTDGPVITVSSPDLVAGLDASVTLQFEKVGQATVRVPVVDGAVPQYRSITASPTPTSPLPTPSS